ncbi:hypothetical protein [Lutibacter sp.]|uniref:hypothetical protein n=1 Tax=Lutibacter sp. TaxID=1925666 RepID=UPI00356AA035
MKEKDFTLLYETTYNTYLDQYIDEIENFYKIANKEGDAQNYAYNSCLNLLENKRKGLKIGLEPFASIYAIYKNRASKVRNNNLNILYTKHIKPLEDKLGLEINNELYEYLLEEFAISEASNRVYSWFSNWHTVYKMMFELNDFSDFKIIRNSSFSEASDIFKKYHEKLYPICYVNKGKEGEVQKNKINNFNQVEGYEDEIKTLYGDFIEYYINGATTSYDDYVNVFFKNWDEHNSLINFSCSTQEASLLLFKLMNFFSDLTYTNIGKSKVFKLKTGSILTSSNYGKRIAPFNPKSGNLHLTPRQKKMLQRANSIVDLIKSKSFKD